MQCVLLLVEFYVLPTYTKITASSTILNLIDFLQLHYGDTIFTNQWFQEWYKISWGTKSYFKKTTIILYLSKFLIDFGHITHNGHNHFKGDLVSCCGLLAVALKNYLDSGEIEFHRIVECCIFGFFLAPEVFSRQPHKKIITKQSVRSTISVMDVKIFQCWGCCCWSFINAESHGGLTLRTRTPCTQPKRVGSGGGSFWSSSSSELSPPPTCPAVVSSYMGGLKSS